MSATDEQFAAAYSRWMTMPDPPEPTRSSWGRQMFAVLEEAGCIPKPQGLTARQELVARVLIADEQLSLEAACRWADSILALGEPQ